MITTVCCCLLWWQLFQLYFAKDIASEEELYVGPKWGLSRDMKLYHVPGLRLGFSFGCWVKVANFMNERILLWSNCHQSMCIQSLQKNIWHNDIAVMLLESKWPITFMWRCIPDLCHWSDQTVAFTGARVHFHKDEVVPGPAAPGVIVRGAALPEEIWYTKCLVERERERIQKIAMKITTYYYD